MTEAERKRALELVERMLRHFADAEDCEAAERWQTAQNHRANGRLAKAELRKLIEEA